MSQEFGRWPKAGEANKRDLQPRAPRMLHRRNAVGVVRRQSYYLHRAIRREICNVNADPHIDSLLLEVRIEVGVGERLGRGVRNPCWIEYETAELQDTQTDRVKVFVGQLMKPSVIAVNCLVCPETGCFAVPEKPPES
jgi:hypothetical protein